MLRCLSNFDRAQRAHRTAAQLPVRHRISLLELPPAPFTGRRGSFAGGWDGRRTCLRDGKLAEWALRWARRALSGCASPAAPRLATPAFDLDDLERRTFDWFWDTANPANGLVPDRWPSKSFCSIAAVGFGLTAYADRGRARLDQPGAGARPNADHAALLRQRAQGPAAIGRDRPQGLLLPLHRHGDAGTGSGPPNCRRSTPPCCSAGCCSRREYFDQANPDETEIRRLATLINDRVDWRWMLGNGPYVSMGWRPEKGHHSASVGPLQ